MPAQEEDLPILIFLAIGALVLVLIVVLGVRSSRRKNRATEPSYGLTAQWDAGQPLLATSSMNAYDGKRQWEIFQQRFVPGTEVPGLPLGDPSGKELPVERGALRVSRVAREVREGYPNARVGFVAYFAPYEQSEFPMALPAGGRGIARVELDGAGVRVLAADGSLAWDAAWADCKVAGREATIRVHNGRSQLEFERDRTPDHRTLEAVLVKYGNYWPMGAV
ncbi:hypothetical protein [Leucobacter iarius]|uniref:Uncharacterized protein n=1 Tax=Leucobacter iarius TaxID=333963 RepID=A0ABN2LQU2_9MICO